jgi:two-component system sensor histidine kinase VicK
MQNNNETPLRDPAQKANVEYNMHLTIVGPEKVECADMERMQLALNTLNIGIWSLDVIANSLIICKKCKELVPTLNKGDIKVAQLLECIKPAYVNSLIKTIMIALTTNVAFDIEVPMVDIKGAKPRWLRINGIASCNDQVNGAKLHGIIEDISDRKNNELLKQDFLAIASHDLKTPLSVIKLYIQLCERQAGDIGYEHMVDSLKKAEHQVNKMDRMIQCYLDSSAINTGEMSHSPILFDIEELLTEVARDLYILHPDRIIAISPGPPIIVKADKEKIAQVLQNLLSNAIKYSRAANTINVYFEKRRNCLQVIIEDKGIGIAFTAQERIFERFYRFNDKNSKAIKGYGIGLYLSREIIKQHNGNIWLESEPNKGSRFFFTLPLP